MILSVDFGTSSMKLLVIDDDYKIYASAQEEYPYNIRPGEKVEMSPDDIMNAFYKACSSLDDGVLSSIDILCYDTYSPSLVLMDGAGNALYPVVTHMDRRSREQSQYIDERFGKENFQKITGVYPFTGGVSITTLLWFMQKEPELVSKTEKIGHLSTYLYKKLTGVWAIDTVNASMMGLYNTISGDGWSEELTSAFGIPRSLLSPVYNSGKILGKLCAEEAGKLHLKEGLPVALGTNDMAAAQVGAGNTLSGQVLNTAGSSDMISILTSRPVIHPRHYLRCSATPGLWQIYSTTSGGFALEWFYKEFCREMSRAEFYDIFLPKCIGLCGKSEIRFDPYLAEDRQSMLRKKAAWHGLTLAATKDEMLAAMLYSMQSVLSETFFKASELIRISPEIKITGGMAKGAMLALKQKVFKGTQFVFCDNCTILGAAKLAMH